MNEKNDKSSRRVGQVFVEFTTKPITAWGGMAALIGAFVLQIDFRGWVEKAIPILETSNNAKGIYPKVLAHFLTVLTGGERFAHMQWWQHGVEAIEKAFDVRWLPKAATTLTRFWNKIKSHCCAERLGEMARDFAKQFVRFEGISEDNLNLDSTVLTRYGKQQGAKKGYNPKKHGRPSHHPLLAFLGSGYVVNLWNRSGNTASGEGCTAFFEQSVAALGEKFRVVRVLCDSGFYLIEFIKHLETKGFKYIIAAPMSPIIQNAIHRVSQWKELDDGIEIAEFYFEHKDKKWTHPRRYVVVRQHKEKRPKAAGKQLSLFEEYEDWGAYRYSLFLTNEDTLTSQGVWREYRPRAKDENILKDLKEGMALSAFNLDNFWATEAVMVMTALVFHNMLHYLNRNIFNRTRPKSQTKTIRAQYFILPAQLGSSGGTYRLRIAVKAGQLRARLIHFLNRIKKLPHRLNCIAVDT